MPSYQDSSQGLKRRFFVTSIDFLESLDGEKSNTSGIDTLQSIRKYGQYHRPIARPILLWLNGSSTISPRGSCQRSDNFRIEVRSSKFLRLCPAIRAFAATSELRTPTAIVGFIHGFPRQTNTEENPVATVSVPAELTKMNAPGKPAQVRVARRSPAYWRVTIDNPPINVMGPEMVKQFQGVMAALEADEHVRVVVFDSAVDDYFLNHSDFLAKLEDLTSLPPGPTGLPPWPDFLARLTRLPVASIALIRGRATGNGSEITLACDMSFASREKAIISQWEVGVGMVAGGGPMARLPHLIGRNRALEVLLSSEDIRADQAEAYGYINRALPDADLDAFVEALATRIAKFDKWAIAQTKRLVNTSLPPEVELGAGWDACIASLGRPAAQNGIKSLIERGFHKPGDVENRLGYYLGQIAP
jgi:enoyl-CoA hydratase/carnithine racemase